MRSSRLALLALLFSGQVFAGAPGPQPTFQSRRYTTDFPTGFVQTREGLQFERRAPRSSFTGSRVPVPKSASLRGRTGVIENQGKCGSCWDFSLTSALRGTLAMKGKDPGRLSFNYLLNCAENAMGCWGGNFAAADYLVDPRGAPRNGADGEYSGRKGRCEPKPVVATAARYHLLGRAGQSPSFEDVAYVVGVLKRPVSVFVHADSSWKSYAGGVFNRCSAGSANHLVVIEGYDCEGSVNAAGQCRFGPDGNLPPGVGTWLVRNSWGETWGDKGWITTKATGPRGEPCNSVASTALYFDAE